VTSVDLATTSGGFGSIGVNMVVGTHAEYVAQQRVSAGFFRVPRRGAGEGVAKFTAEEDRPKRSGGRGVEPSSLAAPVQG